MAVIGWIVSDMVKEMDQMIDDAMWVEWQNVKSKGRDAAIQFLQFASTNLVLGARIWKDKNQFDFIEVDQNILNNIFKGKYNNLNEVVERVLYIWDTGDDSTGENLCKYVINKYTKHPKHTTWEEKEVLKWINDIKKTNILERIQSPTVVEHVHKRTERIIDEHQVEEKIKKLKEVIKQYR